jgi:predicted CoA-binding protein
MSNFTTDAHDFLAQKRIAVAGVSRTSANSANAIYRKLRENGRTVYAINPNTDQVEGDPCYPSIQAIPGGVDGVLIVTRPDLSEQIAHDCVEAGVPRIWMHNNTFMGSSVSDAGAQYAREHGVTVIAGGCPMMFLDFGHKCMRLMLGVMGRLPE